MSLSIKRVYEPATDRDGERILIDGIWPRGVSKERAAVDRWMKEWAPSAELRTWFGHEPARWRGFRTRYFRELEAHSEALEALARRAKRRRITLVYAAREERFNNAVALSAYLEAKFP